MFWEFIFKVFKLEWEVKTCSSCEHLKMLLEQEKREKEKLLGRLLGEADTKREERAPSEPIRRGPTPWASVKRQLEERDRLQAESMRKEEQIRENNKIVSNIGSMTTEQLEESLGIEVENANKVSEAV